MDMGKKNITDGDRARGERIEELFRLNKLTDADVARSMKRTRAVPGRWRSGESFLTQPEDIAKLARILGTTTDYILYGKGPDQINTSNIPATQGSTLIESRAPQIQKEESPIKNQISESELVRFFMEQSKEQQATIKTLTKKIEELEDLIKNSTNPPSKNNPSLKQAANGDCSEE